MLRMFICPKCYNVRMVSRRPSAYCFHCGNPDIEPFDVDYDSYINMELVEREALKERYKQRMGAYNDILHRNIPEAEMEAALTEEMLTAEEMEQGAQYIEIEVYDR